MPSVTSERAPSRRPPRSGARPVAPRQGGVHEPEREGRQLALAAVFEADFGQRTAGAVLTRRLAEGDIGPRAAAGGACPGA